MKIALAQLNYHIGDFAGNLQKIKENIEKAKAQSADLIVFSELSVCGYPPQDLLERKDFVTQCMLTVNRLASETKDIAVLIGAPSLNPLPSGKALFNSAFLLADGKISKTIHKTLLPTYDVFDEYRHFESNTTFEVAEFKGKKIAVTICEDLWDEQPAETPLSRKNLYRLAPMDELARSHPDVIINMAASPFAYTRVQTKRSIFSSKAKKYGIPLLYCNQCGANTELIFEGNSMVFNNKGELVVELKRFSEDFFLFDLDNLHNLKPLLQQDIDETGLIHDALICGIRDFFAKMNFHQATLGLSGGIDSAVTLVLAVKALGNKNVRVLLMPSKYSSDHSVTDSVLLAKKLNVQYDIIPIEDIVQSFKNALSPLFAGLPENIAEENIQARIRGVLLMALSNKLGHILLNTSNKSEAAVGYGTLYGDMAGGLSVLGDVYKTGIYKLAEYINNAEEIIPRNIIEKAPSAELRPNQKDTDSLPEYSLLDEVLYRYIELQQPVSEIIQSGYNEQMVKRIVMMVNANEYKRYQSPPMLRVSPKAFGIGRRMPLVAKY